MRNLSKKIRELEKNVVSDIPDFGETEVVILNPAEQYLHHRAKMIAKRYQLKMNNALKEVESCPDKKMEILDKIKLDPDEQAIVDKSRSLMVKRIMKLFDVTILAPIHLDDSWGKMLFYERFNWFLSEMTVWLFLSREEIMIMSQPDFFSRCPGGREQRLRPVYDQWREWFSKESWKKYWNQRKPKSKSFEKLSPEEKKEWEMEEKRIEKEAVEEEELYKKFLQNTCPICKIKCDWYHKQIESN